MIRQVVFDFGQVLVHFDPRAMIAQDVRDPQAAALLEEVLFDRAYWDLTDAGTLSDEDLLVKAKARLPESLWGTAESIYYDWIYRLPEIEGMYALVSELKAAGMPLYLLSNISHYFADHEDEIPILALFERRFYSARLGLTKPHRAIFDHVCAACNALPSETVFIDDSEKNIRGALDAGWQAVQFNGSAADLRRWFVRQGILA